MKLRVVALVVVFLFGVKFGNSVYSKIFLFCVYILIFICFFIVFEDMFIVFFVDDLILMFFCFGGVFELWS